MRFENDMTPAEMLISAALQVAVGVAIAITVSKITSWYAERQLAKIAAKEQ